MTQNKKATLRSLFCLYDKAEVLAQLCFFWPKQKMRLKRNVFSKG